MLLGHVKWFTDSHNLFEVAPITTLEFVVVLLFVITALPLMQLVEQRFESILKRLQRPLTRFSDYLPTIVRYVAAVMLLVNSWLGFILAPNIVYSGQGSGEIVTLAAFVLAGLMLLIGGVFIKPAAALIIAGYITALLAEGVLDGLEHVEYVAVAGYLFLAGETRALLPGLRAELTAQAKKLRRYADDVLLIIVGLDLVILAFSEKLFNITLASHFLADYQWNVLAALNVSDRTFILLAGAIELLIGLSFIFNVGVRIASLLLLSVMIVTALLLGVYEVVGHLFALAVVAVIWIPHQGAYRYENSRIWKQR